MSRKKGFRLIVFILGSLMSNLVLSSIEIDGLLDEEEWKLVAPASNFIQQEKYLAFLKSPHLL